MEHLLDLKDHVCPNVMIYVRRALQMSELRGQSVQIKTIEASAPRDVRVFLGMCPELGFTIGDVTQHNSAEGTYWLINLTSAPPA
ncbi:hypothetical protein [Motilimonas eburnea]|uniref:hypothetical protein n=1 Tax=Motilimonas eburnea TaxID=1737488 RepID=UPI001E3EB065|nr:hypothetical protein [Motilimonas eburnea]MCE2571669.1 hypothetical protein [Motilimonas eburnea]